MRRRGGEGGAYLAPRTSHRIHLLPHGPIDHPPVPRLEVLDLLARACMQVCADSCVCLCGVSAHGGCRGNPAAGRRREDGTRGAEIIWMLAALCVGCKSQLIT